MERIKMQAREEQDKKIYQAVLDCGINVSRDELIKALKYDRDQYVKGYEDGKADAMQWIPCSERLPDELTPVNVTWVNRNPTIYYENIKDIPFTATAVYCNEKWFWWSSICEDILAEYGRNDAEMVDEGVEILAWMPLPEPYKEEE